MINFLIIRYCIDKVSKIKTMVSIPKMKVKPPLNQQFSTLSSHSHRLSLARSSNEEELDEQEKPYDAPMMRIFGLNKPEWPLNLIGNFLLTKTNNDSDRSLLRV